MQWRSVLKYLVVGVLTFLGASGLGFLILHLIGDTGVPFRHEEFVVLMFALVAGLVVGVALSFMAYETRQVTHRLRRRRTPKAPEGDPALLDSTSPSE